MSTSWCSRTDGASSYINWSKRIRYIHRFLMALTLLAVTVVAVPAQRAQAGMNGQQVHFHCSNGLPAVTVKGENQDGNVVTWQGSAGPSEDAYTSGWWWVGNVRITYETRVDSPNWVWRAQTDWVDKEQRFSDWEDLTCRP